MNYTKLSDKELYKYCREVGGLALKYRSKFAGTLPEVFRRRLFRKYRMGSIYEFASKLAGIHTEIVDRVLNLDSKLVDRPLLRARLVNGETGWSKIEVAEKLATSETDALWAEKVMTMSKGAIMQLNHDAQSTQAVAKPHFAGEEFQKFSIDLSADNIQQLQVLKIQLKTLTWNETITEMVKLLKEAKQTKTRTVKQSETITRHVPAAINRELSKVCTFQNCSRPARETHHPTAFAIRPNHENLQPLCKQHHELVHHGVESPYNIIEQLQKPANYINQRYQFFKIGGT